MAKKRVNHDSTIRTLVKGISQLAHDADSESELGQLQAIFSRVVNSIASNPELATEKNIDTLARLLNVQADPVFTGTVVAGLSIISTRTDLSFGAVDQVAKIFIEALEDADLRRGIEFKLMSNLMDIVKTHNTLAHAATGALLSFLYDNENLAFASIAGGNLARIALNTSGTLRVAIEDALHKASNDEKNAIRMGGESGLRVLKSSKLEALKNLAASLPPSTLSP